MNKTTYYLTMALEALEEMAGNLGMTSEPAVITDIKEALAQEQEPVAYLHQCEKKPELKELSFKKNEPALSAKGYKSSPLSYTAPPQRTEQEPVAWARYPRYTGKAQLPEIVFKKPDGKDWLELYTHAPQLEQEPVAWRTFDGEGGYDYCSYEDNESYADDWNKRNPNHVGWVDKLYTHAPQRTWVGLTDEDRSELVTLHHGWNEYGQAIEAKLKDKNS